MTTNDSRGEFFTPNGFFENASVQIGVGMAALVAELSLEEPYEPRVAYLRHYVDTRREQVELDERTRVLETIEQQYS